VKNASLDLSDIGDAINMPFSLFSLPKLGLIKLLTILLCSDEGKTSLFSCGNQFMLMLPL